MSWPSRRIRMKIVRKRFKRVGNNVSIMRGVEFMDSWNIEVGDNVVINKGCLLDGRGGLKIGNNVDIARDCFIWTAQHDPNNDEHQTIYARVEIGDYCWLSSRSTILPGKQMGRGSILAAGAILTHNTKEQEIWAGIPAKKIGDRHSKLEYTLNWHPKYE